MLNSDVVIRVENLGKTYLIPQKHANDFADAPGWRERLKEFFPGLLGAGDQDYFWALKDVSFQVRRGEVFGIMGENGSGKSTLLKMLSGVTPPSEGFAELQGRIGSLLEVGTGFHPDLTGRENIFFNGSLLGIRQAEIRSKLQGIIDFSGIGEFIDVPVKRYSSGMYVRLAYSVAALLDSDIMILDEVLAVGDSAFRSKTQDNIQEATKSGKTVLFVSHNPRAVATICTRGIILHKGRIVFEGDAKDIVAEYLSRGYVDEETGEAKQDETTTDEGEKQYRKKRALPQPFADISKTGRLRHQGLPDPTMVLKWISIHKLNGEPCAEFKTFEGMKIRIGFDGVAEPGNTYFSVLIQNSVQERMVTAHSTHTGHHLGPGASGVVECTIPQLMLGDGLYSVMIDTGSYDFSADRMVTQDCVGFATYIRVKTDSSIIGGIGLDEFRGAAHVSQWNVAE